MRHVTRTFTFALLILALIAAVSAVKSAEMGLSRAPRLLERRCSS